jgi:hypothetical protein
MFRTSFDPETAVTTFDFSFESNLLCGPAGTTEAPKAPVTVAPDAADPGGAADSGSDSSGSGSWNDCFSSSSGGSGSGRGDRETQRPESTMASGSPSYSASSRKPSTGWIFLLVTAAVCMLAALTARYKEEIAASCRRYKSTGIRGILRGRHFVAVPSSGASATTEGGGGASGRNQRRGQERKDRSSSLTGRGYERLGDDNDADADADDDAPLGVGRPAERDTRPEGSRHTESVAVLVSGGDARADTTEHSRNGDAEEMQPT